MHYHRPSGDVAISICPASFASALNISADIAKHVLKINYCAVVKRSLFTNLFIKSQVGVARWSVLIFCLDSY